ncbi:SAM dependent carboxyl methyltransferase [Arabidopsis thaliana x Arabidopsis arenosa]|uniref:SAM dependent carboxyl methyltransferase n=1 Tax=Arabidopsis thaliana x Arabidopsis arenosa TaxID=1240361 RepID=A0A8T2AZS2_9BRAS|nr:SAM dependent carboxyl methyltransferase [Arabidopsis thaliana x Arabidopsis arenosa]
MSPSRDTLVDALSMKGGTGDHSYATNSHYQRSVFYEIQPTVIESVREMLVNVDYPGCIKVADLGCSTGQNTVLAMSAIAYTILESYQQISKNPPEIDCYLNDLPENDFNTTFKCIPSFQEKLKMEPKGKCFVSGVPGSFYSRLFPRKSLHFVHSAFSIHWLSKIPDGLESNTKSIYIKYPYPPNVYKSYLNQFKNDFSLFLKMRSEEIVHNGHMVLTFVGRKVSDSLSNDCFQVWSLLSDCLLDLSSEGFVNKSVMESFNMPFYNPNEEEVREVILKDGSFEINKIEKFDHVVPYKIDRQEEDEHQSLQLEAGIKHASWARCITEPLLVAHFGDAIIEPVFNKYAHYMAKYLSVSNHRPNMTLVIVVSLTRK